MALVPATLEAIHAETRRAVLKHGETQTPLNPDLPDGDKLAILGEEFGEVCRALTYDGGEGARLLRAELIQVASVAACWAQSLERRIKEETATAAQKEADHG